MSAPAVTSSEATTLRVCVNDRENIIPEEEVATSVVLNKDDYAVERKKSLQARYYFGIIFLITNLVAWFFRDYGQSFIPWVHYIKVCGNEGDDCFHSLGVLRVSLGSYIFFLVMFLTTVKTRKMCEGRNSWHSGWWELKSVLLLVSMALPFLLPSEFVQIYGEIARFGAGIFLLLQLVSVVHFITWWSQYWTPDEEKKQRCSLGLFLSTLFYVASIAGVVFMYTSYASRSSCSLNIFFITWTAILLSVMMAVSLHPKELWLLTLFSSVGVQSEEYILFVSTTDLAETEITIKASIITNVVVTFPKFDCAYEKQNTIKPFVSVAEMLKMRCHIYGSHSWDFSEPAIIRCEIHNQEKGYGGWITILGFLIAVFAIVMAAFSTGIDTKCFQFSKNKVEQDDVVPYNYGFFHMVFSLGAMYFAMLFISWDLNNSARKWSIDVGWASTWVKVINEWFAATIYIWMLISPVVRQNKVMANDGNFQETTDSVTV